MSWVAAAVSATYIAYSEYSKNEAKKDAKEEGDKAKEEANKKRLEQEAKLKKEKSKAKANKDNMNKRNAFLRERGGGQGRSSTILSKKMGMDLGSSPANGSGSGKKRLLGS